MCCLYSRCEGAIHLNSYIAVGFSFDICDETGTFIVSMAIKLHPLGRSVFTILLSYFLAEVDSEFDHKVNIHLKDFDRSKNLHPPQLYSRHISFPASLFSFLYNSGVKKLNSQHFQGWDFNKFFRKYAIFAEDWVHDLAHIVAELETLEQMTWLLKVLMQWQ